MYYNMYAYGMHYNMYVAIWYMYHMHMGCPSYIYCAVYTHMQYMHIAKDTL